jgi:hypothetical protein
VTAVIFDPTVSVGSILTAGSVLASALTLVYTLIKDQRLRRHEAADRVRAAAARTLVGLLRWREQVAAFYTFVDPLFVDASESLVAGESLPTVKGRLWKGLLAARSEALKERSAENLESAYAGLLAYDPRAYQWALDLFDKLRLADESSFASFTTRTQQSLSNVHPGLTAPQVSNQLRADARWEKSISLEEASRHTMAAEEFLEKLINQGDRALIERRTPASPLVAEPRSA